MAATGEHREGRLLLEIHVRIALCVDHNSTFTEATQMLLT